MEPEIKKESLFDLEKAVATIDPNISKIRGFVSLSKDLTITDFGDEKQLEVVKDHWEILRTARGDVAKALKGFRQEAINFQKAVIVKEKELIAEITPEEERLKGYLDQAKEIQEKKRRMAILPQRKEQLSTIGFDIPTTNELYFESIDEGLLGMDDKQFDNYFTAVMSAKNEHDRKVIEDEKAKIEIDKQKLIDDKRIEDAKKQARIDSEKEAGDKVERDANNEKIRIKNEKAEKQVSRVKSLTDLGFDYNNETDCYVLGDSIVSCMEIETDPDSDFSVKVERFRVSINKAREEKEAQDEKERKEKEAQTEKERLEKEEDYKKWLSDNGFPYGSADSNFMLKREEKVVTLYKLVSTYKIE